MSEWAVRGTLNAFYVTRNGEKVSGVFGRVELAQDRMDRMIRDTKKKTRPCITCTKPFLSEGPHNRMCPSCRHQHRDDTSYATVRTRSKLVSLA